MFDLVTITNVARFALGLKLFKSGVKIAYMIIVTVFTGQDHEFYYLRRLGGGVMMVPF